MAMPMVALRVVRSGLPWAAYLEMARLTTRGWSGAVAGGHGAGQDAARPLAPGQVVVGGRRVMLAG